MLPTRLVTGAVLIGMLVLLAWLDSHWVEWIPPSNASPSLLMLVGVLVLAPVLSLELHGLLRKIGIPASAWVLVVSAVSGVVSFAGLCGRCGASGLIPLAGTLVFALTASEFVCRGRQDRQGGFAGAAAAGGASLMSFIWIGIGVGSWIAIGREHGAWILAGVVLTVKASDIGAYFVGMTIGRNKLIPSLSPGKTWEGLVGGVAASAAAAGGLSMLLEPHPPLIPIIMTGALLGVAGPVGDLVESLFKREAGVKDTGTILPGMGGLLDVFDSLLLSGPLAWWLMQQLVP
ncbi:MAG: phosphatidate cytidylyltransferase [Phycisphaerales bacterium]|nr:phosphatidate cytidylyltransferase [Phycisphaerales bacterium]